MVDRSKNEEKHDIYNEVEEESFEELFSKSIKRVEEGEILRGTVIKINPEYVVVDIGYKCEGQIPVFEFIDQDGKIQIKEGDKIDVFVERKETEDGYVLLSKQKASKFKIWETIEKVIKENGSIEGKIVERVKGGFIVDIGAKAFLPGSQADIKPIKDFDSLVGKSFQFKILKANRKKTNIIVSRKALLEEERDRIRKRTIESLREGLIVDGIVKNITDYGAFIDIGGVDGLLHISDISWGRISHPSDILSIGDCVKVIVTKYDRKSGRVSLGMKQLMQDPWESVDSKYRVGMQVKAKVIGFSDDSAIVEIEPGIEGKIHISDLTWTKKVKYPYQIVSMGEIINPVIMDINRESKKMILGLKQTQPDPWIRIMKKYPPGSKIKGRIRKITDFGIFVEIEEGIDGLVHISDISWTQRIKHPSEIFKKGEVVEAVVLQIERESEKISLGIKQLEKNPWENIRERYPVSSVVRGRVRSITEFGAFVELEPGVEGLVHVSEFGKAKGSQKENVLKVDDEIAAVVTSVNERERKISLSIRALEEKITREEIEEFLRSQEFPKITIGDLIKARQKRKS